MMQMSMSMNQSLLIEVELQLPNPTNWSAVNACQEDSKHGFVFPLTRLRQKISGFETYSHEQKMQLVEHANEQFHYDYGMIEGAEGRKPRYYRIPLMRDDSVNLDRIKERITEEDYLRATFIVENVGQLERIARAVPYHGLLKAVREHLQSKYNTQLEDVALVSVDRGGRLPSEILQRALNINERHSIKVDQGSENIDEEMMENFAETGAFKDKHVLFVDSTVDSGRQIAALSRYFNDKRWKKKLGFRDWSIVGSNENGKNLKKHLNVNWGVDPDRTFEDNPALMGIDYAPGFSNKVIDVTGPSSEKIREVMFSVPDGYVFDTNDYAIDDIKIAMEAGEEGEDSPQDIIGQIALLCEEVTSTQKWEDYSASGDEEKLKEGNLPLPQEERIQNTKILLIGGSEDGYLTGDTANAIAGSFDRESCTFLTGTAHGNPGWVAQKASGTDFYGRLYRKWENREVKQNMYYDETGTLVDGTDAARRKMVEDSEKVLVLGGGQGTLKEVFMSLRLGKPTYIVQGWGPVAKYVAGNKFLRTNGNLYLCESVREALEKIRG